MRFFEGSPGGVVIGVVERASDVLEGFFCRVEGCWLRRDIEDNEVFLRS